jgi:transcription elongation factor Elf1
MAPDLPGQTFIDSLLPPSQLPPLPVVVVRGLTCPACEGRKLYVVSVKKIMRGALKRYRQCRACGHKMKTIERPVPTPGTPSPTR